MFTQEKQRFVVGDTLVGVVMDGDIIRVTDGENEWIATKSQLKNHYTPVSESADGLLYHLDSVEDDG